MFRKTIKDVLRKLDISKQEYDFIVSHYGDYTCKLISFGANLDYYDLYKLKNSCHSVFVFQGLSKKSVLDMNPFKDAIVISQDWTNNRCRIHRFHPWAFTQVIVLRDIEDIKPNFEIYNVFRPNGNIVSNFEDLKNREEFFAISKQTFSGRTDDGWFPGDHPIHMILRWGQSYLGQMG